RHSGAGPRSRGVRSLRFPPLRRCAAATGASGCLHRPRHLQSGAGPLRSRPATALHRPRGGGELGGPRGTGAARGQRWRESGSARSPGSPREEGAGRDGLAGGRGGARGSAGASRRGGGGDGLRAAGGPAQARRGAAAPGPRASRRPVGGDPSLAVDRGAGADAGVMTRIAFALVFLCVACRGEGGPAPAPEAAETPPTEVAALRWVPVSAPQDASLLEAPAVVRAAAGASGEVSSSYRARVERVHTQVGSRVERGDPIVDVLAPEVFVAAAAYVGSKRRLELHAERAEELERLRAEGLVEKSRVFEHRMLAAELQARRDEARAVLRAAGVNPQTADALARGGALTLRAPVGGIVVELDAQPGEIREAAAGPLARTRGEGSARVEVRTPGACPAGDRAVPGLTDGRESPLRGEPVAVVIDPVAGTHVH